MQFLAVDGALFTWGRGALGALGLGGMNHCDEAQPCQVRTILAGLRDHHLGALTGTRHRGGAICQCGLWRVPFGRCYRFGLQHDEHGHSIMTMLCPAELRVVCSLRSCIHLGLGERWPAWVTVSMLSCILISTSVNPSIPVTLSAPGWVWATECCRCFESQRCASSLPC